VDPDTLAAFGMTFEIFEFVLPTWTRLRSAKLVEEDRERPRGKKLKQSFFGTNGLPRMLLLN
jgi:hypothetical protein